MANPTTDGAQPELRPLQIEANGINVITDAERKGHPRDLFWPWFAANISVLGLGYGAFVLDFGVSFWQAIALGLIGIIVSFLLCGFIAVAGKRGSAPTMVLGRAAFGVRGNKLPSLISWLLTVGWETVLIILATLATATVFERLGWGGGTVVKVIALIVVSALTVAGGVMGFDLIMRMQTVITWVTGVLTIVFIALVADHIHWHTVSAIPAGSPQKFIGALVFVMTGFGLGWVNAAADYSRYLPRRSSGRGVIGWTTFGSSIAPIFLLVFGLLLAGSSAKLSSAIGADPVGALTTLLPTWFLVPFAIVAVLGLVGGSVLDIYSSGLALLTLGLRIPRYAAALIDGTVMVLGTIYVVFVAHNFLNQFEGFLITLGVPIAAWCGIMLADIMLRRKDYSEPELYDPRGRYGDIRLAPLAIIVVATVVGWGLVTNTYASWLTWQGYLLGPLGLGGKTGAWAFANLGVLVALVIGFVAGWALDVAPVRAQESRPALASAAATADDQTRGLPGGHRHAAGVRRAGQRLAGPAVRRDRQAGPRPGGGVRSGRGVHPVRRARHPGGGLAALLRGVAVRAAAAGRAHLRAGGRVRRGGRADAWTRSRSANGARSCAAARRSSGRLVLAGVTTDCCVLSTAVAAADDGRRGPGRRGRVRGRGRRQPPQGAGHPPALRPADRGGQPG